MRSSLQQLQNALDEEAARRQQYLRRANAPASIPAHAGDRRLYKCQWRFRGRRTVSSAPQPPLAYRSAPRGCHYFLGNHRHTVTRTRREHSERVYRSFSRQRDPMRLPWNVKCPRYRFSPPGAETLPHELAANEGRPVGAEPFS